MIQIGIHNTGDFSSASLFVDGELKFASPEERLSRIKFDNDFPWRAIYEGLRLNNIELHEVDEFVVAWNPFINAAGRYRGGLSRWVPHPMHRLYSNVNHILPRLSHSADISEQIINIGNGRKVRIKFVNHHLAHIGLSFNTSPYREAAVMISDGYGEKASTVYAKCTADNNVEIVKTINFPQSLGMFYATFTDFVGFTPEKDEWKLMGASAYGNPDKYYDNVTKLIKIYDNGEYELDLSYFNFYNFDTCNTYSQKFIREFGEPNKTGVLSQREYDLAAAVQKVFEKSVFKLLTWLHEETHLEHLCLGGGIFMNSLLNGKIALNTPFHDCFIPFSPDDAGNSIGAVMHLNQNKVPFMSPYIAGEFSNENIRTTLDRYSIQYENYDDEKMCSHISAELAKGKVIGWFNGKMEFGQRALGNRSIIASPRNREMKDKVNNAVKYREHYRPFAPSILYEDGGEYFENYQYVPYMEKVLPFKENKTDQLKAVVHEDLTGRLQTVKEDINPMYYRLIKRFCSNEGLPVVLNTSFNKAGEAIVYTPDDAIRTFFTSGIDLLVMNNYLVSKG